MIALALAVLILGVLAALAARTEGGWVAPAALFALLWCGYLASAAMFVVDPDIFQPALLWIVAACIAVYLGSVGSRLAGRSGMPLVVPGPDPLPYLRGVTLALVVACMAEVWLIFANAGFSLRSVVSFAVIAQVSSVNRYTYGYGDLQQGTLEKVLLTLVYAAPLFGGVLFRVSKPRVDRILGVVTLLGTVFISTLYGSRMGALFGGAFWISAYVASHILIAGLGGGRSTGFVLRIGLLATVVMLGLSVGAMLVRYYVTDRDRPMADLVGDAFGFVVAFAYWFKTDGLRVSHFLLGAATFERLFGLVGIVYERPPVIDIGFLTTNIYTVFRGLIEDFGVVGALAALASFGVVGGHAYRHVARGNWKFLPILVIVYAFALVSFSLSVFTYTTVTVAWLLFCFYFVVIAQAQRILHRRDSPTTVALGDMP